MRSTLRALLLAGLASSLAGCGDDYLTTQPQTIVTDERLWNDPRMVTGVIADYYDRLPDNGVIFNTFRMTSLDDAIWSGGTGGNPEAVNQILEYPDSMGAVWDYTLIRDINLAIENIERSNVPAILPVKAQFLAELRFLRAFSYFEHVKRMGGVPLVTSLLVYDFSGDPSYLQTPRAAEAAVYDFIASEIDAIVGQLGNQGSRTRANRFTALALKSRAMLYAGSIARHNNELPNPITLPGGEVGIPAARAQEYYTKSLEASREIIQSNAYSLHRANDHLGMNFYEAVSRKSGNPEVIWAEDYLASQGKSHLFTVDVIPRSMRLDVVETLQGFGVTPTLQLVESFDYLNGSSGELRGTGTGSNTAAGQSSWIFYRNKEDIFAGKDARLYGTVGYPGTAARGVQSDLQAGVYVWNASTNKYDRVEGPRQSEYVDGGTLTGIDGPRHVESATSATGFYLRKYLDNTPSAATGAVGSDMWWVRFRLGEIYLNGAEAAFELGLHGEALEYLNTLRERAGFAPGSLTTVNRERIRNERRVELAFEDHRYWDVRRWRIAHILWDGTATSTTANAWSLFPYRVVHPGHPNDGTFVYDKFRATRQTRPRFFRMSNYYSAIPAAALGNNPKLVANPGH